VGKLDFIKNIFFDLDGTLLDNNLDLNNKTIKGLKKINEKGIGVSIVSARMLGSIKGFLNDFQTNYLSALNGSLIFNTKTKKIEVSNSMHFDISSKIISRLKKDDLAFNIFTIDNVYISRYSKDNTNAKYQRTLFPKMLVDFNKDQEVYLIELILDSPDHLEDYRKHLKNEFSNSISLTDGGYNCLEINKNGIDKGSSLEYIADKLGIGLKETMAIGDSETDVSMIKNAGVGIAMKVSNEKLLKAADLITKKTNDENGALDFILDILK
jgi:hypothetical protein